MAEIIRDGTVEQRDLMGARLLELTFDAPRRLEMMHGDAHPGNFMLLPDGRMGVIDFGAVAPLPGGFPIELGMTMRLAREKNYDLLLPTMEKVGFIQKGRQVSVRDIDEMLRQYVEPVEVEVFHYTRKWLQRMTTSQIDRSVSQIKTARQMDLPPKLAIPMRVHRVGRRDPVSAGRTRADQGAVGGTDSRLRRTRCSGCLKARQRPDLARTSARPLAVHDAAAVEDLPPHTPHGSARRSAAARHARRIGQSAHNALARSKSDGLSANHRSGSLT